MGGRKEREKEREREGGGGRGLVAHPSRVTVARVKLYEFDCSIAWMRDMWSVWWGE